MMIRLKLLVYLMICGFAGTLRADNAKFNLPGPAIDVYVTRRGITLPVAQVPNLMPMDKLRVKMDLPATQLNHLLLIVVFLRSSTNEPPDDWFTKIETWKAPAEGTAIIVPTGAQRALLFIAPETGGDFETLRSAVKGNPGTFLMAGMSLDKVSYDQQRIAKYLAGMQPVALSDEAVIKARSTALAAALALKPSDDCYKQPVADQVDCLTETSAPLLLDDGHGQTIGDALSSGASSNFINEASTTDGGVYSAYVGTLVDLVHLAEMLHTAQYRYIPAITFPQGATLNLMLNAAPSFNNPKSVIVVGLPGIHGVHLPQFTLPNAAQVFCLPNPAMSLPLRGAPLFFSTSFAHDLTLEMDQPALTDHIRLVADASAGGLIRGSAGEPTSLRQLAQQQGHNESSATGAIIRGTVHGYWGFDEFSGPTLRFQRTKGGPWTLIGSDTFQAGKDASISLRGSGSACIDQVALVGAGGNRVPVVLNPDAIHEGVAVLPLNLPLKTQKPGAYTLVMQETGSAQPTKLALTLSSSGIVPKRSPGTVLQLLRFDTTPSLANDELAITLSSKDDIPLNGTLRFVVQSLGIFPHTQAIELATADGSTRTRLTLAGGNLILQDDHTVVGSVNLLTIFGQSAFGKLRLRSAAADGSFGDWIPVGNLVRRPHISAVACTNTKQPSCRIEGKDLFLALAFSTTQSFEKSSTVPSGFDDPVLLLPMDAMPRNRQLFVKLRDGSNVIATIQLSANHRPSLK